MSYLILPKRVFNSPLIESVNFQDGSFVNLIKLIKPYANGDTFAVYETTKSTSCSNGLFKTYDKAKAKFELTVKNGNRESEIRNYYNRKN
jgi:antitoxin component YwqK of YwqJK toxin-antitoxin module